MKRFAVAISTAAALLAGCATMPDAVAVDPAFDPAATEFTGWVRVSGGEFQLYAEQRQLSEPFSRPCASGALPRNAQRTAQDLSGSQVTFTGRAAPWSDRDGVQTLMHEGSRISNQCRGAFVIKADSVRVLR